MKKIFFLLAAFALVVLAFSSLSLAVDVKNPQNVEYMKAEITQSGSVLVSGVDEINVSLYIPQSDSAQTVEIEDISNQNYFLEKDKYGNGKVNMLWKNPESQINFVVKTVVTINRRSSGNFYNLADFSKPSELIQPLDPEIKALAESLTLGKKTDFEKIASLTKWVNENIEYDLAYSDVNLSATTVLQLRKGVCDEFSTLLLSMVRSLGYKASYVVGYAYGKGYTFSEGDFAPHGWTEIYTPSGTIISDPTWGEIPADASHIRFASLADSIYPEVNVSGAGKKPVIKINPTKTEINILEIRENPIIESKTSLLEQKLWKGYVVAKTELSAQGCVLTKLSSQSCTIGGSQLLQPKQNDSIIYFCGSRNIFSIFGIPNILDANKIYTCPISFYAYNSNPNTVNITLEDGKEGRVKLSLDRNVAEAGEKITAESPDSYLFTSFGQYDFDNATFIAYDNMAVYAYNDGALDRQDVSIVSKKYFEIVMQANKTYFSGQTGFFNLTLKNLLQKTQNIALDFRNFSGDILVEPLSEKTLNLSFVPSSANDNFLQAYASSGDFKTYASKIVEVQEPLSRNWWDSIAEFFGNIFGSVADFFRKLFGTI